MNEQIPRILGSNGGETYSGNYDEKIQSINFEINV
jgi:hypothetical protein